MMTTVLTRASILFIVFYPLLLAAMPAPITSIDKPAFLSHGFNLLNYQRCKRQLDHCPSYQHPDHIACTKQVIKSHAFCQQSLELANFIHASPTQLQFSQLGKLIVMGVYFPADGYTSYYLIAPNGELLNTLDPRLLKREQLPANLQHYYPSSDWLLRNNGKPSDISLKKDGSCISTPLIIKKSCLSCATLANIAVHYQFNLQGQLTATTVVNAD